jgi:hypothetical protein
MGVKMSEMTADTSVAGTEKILVLDGTTSKTLTTAKMAEYSIDVLAAAAAATPTTGDDILAVRAGAEKLLDLDAVASYAVASAWTVATTASPAVSGDLLLVNRSGTIFDIDVDTLKTYALVGVQASVLNLSGLDAATLANTDLLAICQTTTAKKATIASLETLLWTDFATYVAARTELATVADANKFYVLDGTTPKYVEADTLAAYMSAEIIAIGDIQDDVLDTLDTYLTALSAVTTVANTDLLYCTQGGTAKKLTLLQVANYAVANALQLPWRLIESSKYTATPDSTSSILMSDTSDFAIGLPVKYTYGGTTYYGIVSSMAANVSITVSGAPLVVLSDLTALYVGLASNVEQLHFVIRGVYGDTTQDLLEEVNGHYFKWQKSPAYLVTYTVAHSVVDTGAAQPKVNVKINDDIVSSADNDKGVQVSNAAGTWTDHSAVDIKTAAYRIVRGYSVDACCTVAGTNGDAETLSIILTFVSE